MKLPALFEGIRDASKAAVGVFTNAEQSPWGLLEGLFPSATGEAPDRGTLNYLKAYKTMPWPRSLAGRASEGVASVEWQVFVVRGNDRKIRRMKELQKAGYKHRKSLMKTLKQSGELEQVEDHPILQFIEGGNRMISGHVVRRLTSIHIDMVGEAHWIKERNMLGVPFAAWPLSPHWVLETPTPSHPFYRVGFSGWQGEIPDTEILSFIDPDPENPYGRGTGRMQALADEAETFEFGTKFVKHTFLNRARPDLVISPKGDATMADSDVTRLERGWLDRTQGFFKALKPMFLTKAVDVKEMSQNFRHLQVLELLKHERDTHIQVFGFPPEIIGIVNESKRSTIEAADLHFAKWVLTPRLEMWRSDMQSKLVPEYDENIILDYVSPIAEDHEFTLKAMDQTPHAFTDDEHRGIAGFDPLADGSGQIRRGPLNLFPIDSGGGTPDLKRLSTEELLHLRELIGKAR